MRRNITIAIECEGETYAGMCKAMLADPAVSDWLKRRQRGNNMTKSDKASLTVGESATSNETSADDQRVLDLLEQARQNVKPIVKRELANEVITQEMMAFRFK